MTLIAVFLMHLDRTVSGLLGAENKMDGTLLPVSSPFVHIHSNKFHPPPPKQKFDFVSYSLKPKFLVTRDSARTQNSGPNFENPDVLCCSGFDSSSPASRILFAFPPSTITLLPSVIFTSEQCIPICHSMSSSLPALEY